MNGSVAEVPFHAAAWAHARPGLIRWLPWAGEALVTDKSTETISVCLWFLAQNKGNGRFRDRRGDILKVAGTYDAWRVDGEGGLRNES